jgi:hypothetical protein
MQRSVTAPFALVVFVALFVFSAIVQSPSATQMLSYASVAAPAVAAVEAEQGELQEDVVILPVDEETMWLARVIYSETKRPDEQELVAWTVRNRVETGYRSKGTYRSAVLSPWQYSAFNPGPKRQHYSSLTVSSSANGWQRAVDIAHEVRNAPSELNPFSTTTRHFYSERSMVGRKHPDWAVGKKPVKPATGVEIDPKRFRFFENIA